MTTEDELVATVAKRPDDVELVLVAADWHEGAGNLAAADLLRLHHQLLTTAAPVKLLALAERATVLAKSVPPRWLAAIAHPAVGGHYTGLDSDGDKWEFKFRPGASLYYTRGGMHRDGKWQQLGALVVMSTNKAFTRYAGLATGDRIVGEAITVDHLAWTWDVTRVCQKGRPALDKPAKKKPAKAPPKKAPKPRATSGARRAPRAR